MKNSDDNVLAIKLVDAPKLMEETSLLKPLAILNY